MQLTLHGGRQTGSKVHTLGAIVVIAKRWKGIRNVRGVVFRISGAVLTGRSDILIKYLRLEGLNTRCLISLHLVSSSIIWVRIKLNHS